jgi:hypothetical protein
MFTWCQKCVKYGTVTTSRVETRTSSPARANTMRPDRTREALLHNTLFDLVMRTRARPVGVYPRTAGMASILAKSDRSRRRCLSMSSATERRMQRS